MRFVLAFLKTGSSARNWIVAHWVSDRASGTTAYERGSFLNVKGLNGSFVAKITVSEKAHVQLVGKS